MMNLERLTKHFHQGMLNVLRIAIIGVSMLICFGIGFAGGIVLASWKSVKAINLGQLEYTKVDTWKQHLEIYSSVCTVQRGDAINFLLDKLKRLEYEETQQKSIDLSKAGQYSTELDASGKSGKVWIYLQGFHYPRADRAAYRVEISVRYGKIDSIRKEGSESIASFDLRPELISEIYDASQSAREIVPLTKMPDNLLRAFLAVEDKRFYEHWGVDIWGLLRAALRNLMRTHSTPHGASTITQQLTRNIYLTQERQLVRKVKEALLAFRIEKHYSKDEILERYLNFINFGRYGAREVLGVQEAAKSYFGKPVWGLAIHEFATLAAIPKSPPLYSPIRNPERCKTRRNLVLEQMRRAGYITQAEYDVSINQPLGVEMPVTAGSKDTSHFLEYVHGQLTEIPELEEHLYSQGLRVYTTIDTSMQRVAERAVAEHLRELDRDFPNLPDYDRNKENPNGLDPITNYLQAGLIAIEPQTGYIKAMVGGRDFYITPQKINFYNRAIQAQRQPGSSFKPFVFAAMFNPPPLATPATVVRDEAWFTADEYGKRWSPSNYEEANHYGDVTLRTALEKSINIAAARLMNETPIGSNGKPEGINRTIALAKRLGIQSPLRPYPALSLGASDVTLAEMTAAYAVFANEGVRAEPVSIQYVEDRGGDILVEHPVKRTRGLDENVAYLITSLMEGVIQHGTGRGAIQMGLRRPAAGKTGTTNDYTDAWFVGYIPRLAAGVWVGFDDPKKSVRKTGSKAALPIWAQFMIDGARGPVDDFRVPSGIVFREIDKETGLLKYEGKCPPENIIREAFLVGYEPKMLCNAHE